MSPHSINPPVTTTQLILRWSALALVLAQFTMLAYNFDGLPERVPRHYNLTGQPDAYSPRWLLWGLPAINAILFLLFYHITVRVPPHRLNYPIEITANNAEQQFRQMRTLVWLLMLFISMAFLYIVWQTMRIGLGEATELGNWFLPVFLLLIFSVPAYFMWQGYRKG